MKNLFAVLGQLVALVLVFLGWTKYNELKHSKLDEKAISQSMAERARQEKLSDSITAINHDLS